MGWRSQQLLGYNSGFLGQGGPPRTSQRGDSRLSVATALQSRCNASPVGQCQALAWPHHQNLSKPKHRLFPSDCSLPSLPRPIEPP